MGAVRSESNADTNYGTYFNCARLARTPATFAMTAASIIRRHQHLELGLPDPFAIPVQSVSSRTVTRSSTPIGGQSAASVQLEKVNAQQELNKSLLRLTFLLQSSTY